MNARNLMEAISERPEEKVAQDLLNSTGAENRADLPETAEFISVDRAKTAERRPFRLAHHVMFAASVAAGLALVGGFAYLMHALGNKPHTVKPGASVVQITEETATNAISTGVIEVTTTTTTAAEQGPASVVPAESVMDCREINFPVSLNGKPVSIWGMLDEDTVLVGLIAGDNTAAVDSGTELGTISVAGGTVGAFQKLLTLTDEQNPVAGDGRYLVIAERQYAQDGMVVTDCKYRLFDIAAKKLGDAFWTQSKQDGQPVGGGSYTPPVLDGNAVYFDDYSISAETGEIVTTVYAYDIATGQVTASYENFYRPMLYRGQLVASRLDKTAGTQCLMTVADDGASFAMNYEGGILYAVAGRDGVFALTQDTLKELTGGRTVTDSLDGAQKLTVGDSMAVWSRITADYSTKPMVYDIAGNRLLSLDTVTELPDDAEFCGYTSGRTALVQVNNADRSVFQFVLLRAQ